MKTVSLKVFVVVLVASFVFVGSTAPIRAAEPLLESATVNLYCSLKSGNKTYSSTGSGVVIDSRGIILTNAHVAQYFLLTKGTSTNRAKCAVRTGSPARAAYNASVLYIPSSWVKESVAKKRSESNRGTGEGDYALLVIDNKNNVSFPSLPLDTTTHNLENASVRIAGYPAEDLTFDSVRSKLQQSTATSTVTSVLSFADKQPDMLALTASPINRAGVSGGPVVRATGELVAIAATTSQGADKDKRTLRAITLSHIDRSLESTMGTPLLSLLSEDLATRLAATQKAFSTGLRRSIADTLKGKR